MEVSEAYLKNVQATYRYYCYHVHNDGKGKDLAWYPSRFHMFLCDIVQEFVEKKTDKAFEVLVINTPPQHGKLIADNTPVITSKGWKHHGDLVAGDKVLSPNGEWVKVLAVLPKHYADRKVTFTNGEEIVCHRKHEWLVNDRNNHKERVVETEYMQKRVSNGSKKKRGHRYNFNVPARIAMIGTHKELPVSPYVLGAWLGDGTNRKPTICASPDDDIVLKECEMHYKVTSRCTHKDTGVYTWNYKGLNKALHRYGMCFYGERTEKYIPDDYLTASRGQRLELLAGLIDTDGYADIKHNRMVFTTADEKLRDTFEELIATFGWRATTCECKPVKSSSGIQGRRVYWQIGFNPTVEIPCRIKRKRMTRFSKQRRVSISSIEECEHVQGNCITVEGSYYCVGRSMIPTHNSETITATFPSWYVMRYPETSTIIISYGDVLAQRFGKRNLENVKTYNKIFGVNLDKNKMNATEFLIRGHSGSVKSVGYGSSITGNKADLIIIDDPVKNRVEADSQTDRDKKWADFTDSIQTRLPAGGKIILIMTRWHEDDLAGRILENYPDKTTLVNIPCEAEDNDILGRKPGDALCPEIGKGNEWLKDLKETHVTEEGLRSWNALYQGRPTAREGNMLKREWWEYYDFADYENGQLRMDYMIMSVDAAFKDDKKNDFVAVEVWGKRGNWYYLIDCINEHLNFPNTIKKIRLVKARFPSISAILIEDKANGSAIIQTLRQNISGIIPVEPRGSKEARVSAVSDLIESHCVYLPKDRKITLEFVDQCASFPNGKHDDMVDSMSQALLRLMNRRGLRKTVRESRKGERYFHIKEKKSKGRGDKINVI